MSAKPSKTELAVDVLNHIADVRSNEKEFDDRTHPEISVLQNQAYTAAMQHAIERLEEDDDEEKDDEGDWVPVWVMIVVAAGCCAIGIAVGRAL